MAATPNGNQEFVIEVMWLAGHAANHIAKVCETTAYYVRKHVGAKGLNRRGDLSREKRQREIDNLLRSIPENIEIPQIYHTAQPLSQETKQLDEAIQSTLAYCDDILDKPSEVMASWNSQRKAEGVRRKKMQQADKQRRAMDIQNRKLDITKGLLPDGTQVRVDRISGRLLDMHARNPQTWTKPMIVAAGRFGVDYALSEFSGLGAQSLEMKVDTSHTERVNYGVVARKRVRDLAGYLGVDIHGREHFGILEMYIGLGFSFSEMSAWGLGKSDDLSGRLQKALNKTAVFYDEQRREPLSPFLERAEKIINRIKDRM